MFGMDETSLQNLRSALRPQGSGAVFACNVDIVRAFLAVSSQWRTVAEGANGAIVPRWVGLDYAGASISLNALEITVTPRLWRGLQTMENAAIRALNGGQ